jgi:hypothetical protein
VSWWRWWRAWRRNWNELRAVTDRVGAEVASWPYDALDRPAEQQPVLTRTVGTTTVHFAVDCVGTGPDGELEICVDAVGGPATFLGLRPSYRFYKRRDGTVHHGPPGRAPAA